MDPSSEEQAHILAAQRSPEAFSVLYEAHFGAIFRFLLRRAGDHDLAADLTQQTFLKAMLALPRYQPRGVPFRAFLYRIALNELQMHWRKRKEVVIDLTTHEVRDLQEEMGLPEIGPDTQPLTKALGRLSADQGRLVQLRFMDGMSFAEIGMVLNIGEDAAKMRTHRVLRTLRTYLSDRP